MHRKEDVIDVILRHCPSFEKVWISSEDKELLYIVMGDFSRYVISALIARDYKQVYCACIAIEDLHVNGDGYVKELATIGILEGIRNNFGHKQIDGTELMNYLRPVSMKYWKSLIKFWNQEIPFVGYDVINSAQPVDALSRIRQPSNL